jgi:DNA mismatch endonuclease (patch repair protein)
MTDSIEKEKRSEIMKAVRSSGSKLEKKLAQELWRNGIRYRKNVKDLKGKPDFAIKRYKTVIFVDSCFWHGCKEHCRIPQSNRDYWTSKINRNKERDQETTQFYENENWTVIRVWEHEMKTNFMETSERVLALVKEQIKWHLK